MIVRWVSRGMKLKSRGARVRWRQGQVSEIEAIGAFVGVTEHG